jgi:hypothetical protein
VDEDERLAVAGLEQMDAHLRTLDVQVTRPRGQIVEPEQRLLAIGENLPSLVVRGHRTVSFRVGEASVPDDPPHCFGSETEIGCDDDNRRL